MGKNIPFLQQKVSRCFQTWLLTDRHMLGISKHMHITDL